MKKLLIASLAMTLLGVSAASAQTAGPKAGTPPVSAPIKAHAGAGKKLKRMHEAMLAKLNLTPEQKAKIDAHDKSMEAERKVLVKSEKGTKGDGKSEATKEKLKALKKANKAFYKETLTKDQLKELKKLKGQAKKDASTTAPVKP